MKASSEQTATTQRGKKATKRIILEVIIVLVILVPAIFLSIYLKEIVISRVYKAVELKRDNPAAFKTWLNPPTTITRDYYLFNVTNPIEVATDPNSAVLQIKETPPYSYLLSATKEDVSWSADEKEINYSIYRSFSRHPKRFNPSSVNDTGVFVDLLRASLRTQFDTKASDAFYTLGGVDQFYHRNAVEQIEGFTSDLHRTMQEKMTGPNTKKSGFIYRYNGSRSYNYTIKTGLMEKGQVLGFASENVPFTFGKDSYHFTIYDGLTFVPMLFDKPSMNIFQADFCRPISVKFNRKLSMFGGIEVHEYVIKLIDFTQCTDLTDINSCPEVDKLDVSPCISASLPPNTVFLSKVHFYGSSNETMEEMNIEGFTPEREKHEALIYFEPYSGTPLRAYHRIQLNIDAMIDPMRETEYGLEPKKKKSVRRLLPLLWIDQEVNVDAATVRTLRMVHIALRHGKWIILLLAVVLIAIILVVIELMARRATNGQRLKRGGNEKTDTLL